MRRLIAVRYELTPAEDDTPIAKGRTSIRSVTVESLRAGQPRPYADEEYEGILTFTVPDDQLWAGGFPSREEDVKEYVKLMIHGFVDKLAGETWEWHQPWLKELERLGPERPIRWRALVIGPYLD